MSDQETFKFLKFGLLAHGLSVAEACLDKLSSHRPMVRTRSGVSGGLEVRFSENIYVNCELTNRAGLFELSCGDDRWSIRHPMGMTDVSLLPRPAFYDQQGRDGTALMSVGQLCSSDRICVGMTRHCALWRPDLRCSFCSIGKNTKAEASRKPVDLIVEAVLAAANDPVSPARHVLVGGGTPNLEDMGAELASQICRAIKRVIDIPIYVMLVPPSDLSWVDRLQAAGADELGFNMEFGTERSLQLYAPGKASLVGRAGYIRALEYTVERFGPTNTRSILIAGLEPASDTIDTAIELASMGVMPILSPFRALPGTQLAATKGMGAQEYVDLHDAVLDGCAPYGIVPGPTCIACQNNTLAMPYGPAYRHY